MSELKGYIYKETAISAGFNAIFSVLFTVLVFSGESPIPRNALVADAGPQSFFVAFFAVFVPTLLTRRRRRSGLGFTVDNRQWPVPYNVFARAILCGLVAALVGVVGHYLLLGVAGMESISFTAALVYKGLYGIALTLLVTPIALCIALSESDKQLN